MVICDFIIFIIAFFNKPAELKLSHFSICHFSSIMLRIFTVCGSSSVEELLSKLIQDILSSGGLIKKHNSATSSISFIANNLSIQK